MFDSDSERAVDQAGSKVTISKKFSAAATGPQRAGSSYLKDATAEAR